MIKRISLIAMISILLLAILGIVEAADRIEFECPEPDGLFPHPVQCDRYFHCRRGIVNRKLCADGLVFDPDKDATFEEPCDLVQESASFGTLRACDVLSKVVLYRDTSSVDPGSEPIFGSVSGSEIHILGIAYAKDTFS